MASAKDGSMLQPTFPYLMVPVESKGDVGRRQLSFWDVPSGHIVKEVAGWDVPVSNVRRPGAGDRLEIIGRDEFETLTNIQLYNFFMSVALALVRKVTQSTSTVNGLCALDPEAHQFASDPGQSLDRRGNIQTRVTEFAQEQRNKKKNDSAVNETFKALLEDQEFMSDLDTFLSGDEAEGGPGFAQLLQKVQCAAASRVAISVVFRPLATACCDGSAPPPGSTASMTFFVAIICPENIRSSAPTLDHGVDRLLSHNKSVASFDKQVVANTKARGAKHQIDFESKTHAERAQDPFEHVVKGVYARMLPFQTDFINHLMHPHFEKYCKVGVGRQIFSKMSVLVDAVAKADIMLPEYERDHDTGELVEKKDEYNAVVYTPKSLALNFMRQYDWNMAISGSALSVSNTLRERKNWFTDRHLDSLMQRKHREEGAPPGVFRRKSEACAKQTNMRLRVHNENLNMMYRWVKVLSEEQENGDGDEYTESLQQLKDHIHQEETLREEVLQRQHDFDNEVLNHPDILKYGFTFEEGKGFDWILETGSAVYQIMLPLGQLNTTEGLYSLNSHRMHPDPVSLLNDNLRKKRLDPRRVNRHYDSAVHSGSTTVHGKSLLFENVHAVDQFKLPFTQKLPPEPELSYEHNLLENTFTEWEKTTQVSYIQARDELLNGRRDYEPNRIFHVIGDRMKDLYDNVGSSEKTCRFLRAAMDQYKKWGVFGHPDWSDLETKGEVMDIDLDTNNDLAGVAPSKADLDSAARLGDLKHLYEEKQFSMQIDDNGTFGSGLDHAERVKRINRRHFLQQKRELEKIHAAVKRKESGIENTKLRRVPQPGPSYDESVCPGQNMWQYVNEEICSGFRILYAHRLVSWAMHIAATAFVLIYGPGRDRVNGKIHGAKEATKSMILQIVMFFMGTFAILVAGKSDKARYKYSHKDSNMCGLEITDEAKVSERAINPYGKGTANSMVSAEGELDKGEMTGGEQWYDMAGVKQDGKGNNFISNTRLGRWVLTTKLGADNEQQDAVGDATKSRYLHKTSEKVDTPITQAAIVADTPLPGSEIAEIHEAQKQDAGVLIWGISALIMFFTALTQAQVIPGIETRSGAMVQHQRDNILEANGEERLSYRKQAKLTEMTKVKVMTRAAYWMFRAPYALGSLEMMKLRGQTRFGPENFLDHRTKLKVVGLGSTNLQDDISSVIMVLEDSKTNQENVIRQAIIKGFVRNNSAAMNFSSLFSAVGKENVDNREFAEKVDLHYVQIQVTCVYKDLKNILMSFARIIEPYITINKEKYTTKVICDILLGIVNDPKDNTVKYPANLDMKLPITDPYGCEQTVLGLQTIQAHMRKLTKSADPEVRSMDMSGMECYCLTPAKLNEVGKKWAENDFSVQCDSEGAQYFPSAFTVGADGMFGQNLLTCSGDSVDNVIIDTSSFLDKGVIKVNTWWLLRGMIQMDSDQCSKSLPELLIEEMAGSSTCEGFYVHGGLAFEDIDKQCPGAFKTVKVKAKNKDKVQAIVNTNLASASVRAQAKMGIKRVPAAMLQHSQTMEPGYPESLANALQLNEQIANKFPEHILSEDMLLFVDTRGLIHAGPEFINRAIDEYIKRCLDTSNPDWSEYHATEVEFTSKRKRGSDCDEQVPVLKGKMDTNLGKEVLEYLFMTPPEDGGLAQFARSYLKKEDLLPDYDEHGNLVYATRGRFYDNSITDQIEGRGRAKQLAILCMYQYTGNAEGSFSVNVSSQADASYIESQIQKHTVSFNNGGYHPSDQEPEEWDKTPYLNTLSSYEIDALPQDIGRVSMLDKFNYQQNICRAMVKYWIDQLSQKDANDKQQMHNMSREVGTDLSKYGPTYYDSRMANMSERTGVCNHRNYVIELGRLARKYHKQRMKKWSLIGIHKEYVQNKQEHYNMDNFELQPPYQGTPEQEDEWEHFSLEDRVARARELLGVYPRDPFDSPDMNHHDAPLSPLP